MGLAVPLDECRCPGCKNLLFKAKVAPGSVIEIKCRRCGESLTIERADDGENH